MGILNEIMGWTSYIMTQGMAVTSDLNVKFFQPVYIREETIKVSCRVISKEGPKVNMLARLSNSDGNICTEATGTFHILSPCRYSDLIQGK